MVGTCRQDRAGARQTERPEPAPRHAKHCGAQRRDRGGAVGTLVIKDYADALTHPYSPFRLTLGETARPRNTITA